MTNGDFLTRSVCFGLEIEISPMCSLMLCSECETHMDVDQGLIDSVQPSRSLCSVVCQLHVV